MKSKTITSAPEAAAFLKDAFMRADRAVFFGGAGVSTASGIPDFRSQDGLYNQQYAYPPEEILSHTFYERKPKEFWRFYHNKMLALDARPNAVHTKLAHLEQEGHLRAVVTQNIDGLHQAAGSTTVYELHGSVHRNYCTRCGAFYDAHWIYEHSGAGPDGQEIPLCEYCGAPVKPAVVLYEEGLDGAVLRQAVDALAQADVLVIGGTSLVVYPAAGLVQYFGGKTLVVVNKTPTPADAEADVVCTCDLAGAFSW